METTVSSKVARRARYDGVWLGLGFFAFGFALSWTTALTQAEGSGTALLTGFFSFVGGAFLSFAGFRLEARSKGRPGRGTSEQLESPAQEEPGPTINAMTFGVALFALSTGLIVGGPAAYLVRTGYLRHGSVRAPAEAPRQETPEATTAPVAVAQNEVATQKEAEAQKGGTQASPFVYQLGSNPDEVLSELRLHIAQRALLSARAQGVFAPDADASSVDDPSGLLILLRLNPPFLLSNLEGAKFRGVLEQPELRREIASALAREKEELASLSTKQVTP